MLKCKPKRHTKDMKLSVIYCRRENIQVNVPVIGLTNFPLLCKFYNSILSITSIFQLEVKHQQLEEWCSNLCVRPAHIKELYVHYPAYALS